MTEDNIPEDVPPVVPRRPASSEMPAPTSSLAAALACQPDLLVVRLDGAGRILDWPPAARRLLGWPAEDVVGHSAGIVFSEEHRGVLEDRLEEAGGHAGEWRALLRTAGDEILPVGVRLLFFRAGEEALMVLRDQRGTFASEQWLRWSRGLLSVLGGATLVLDPGGRIREIGSGWLPDGESAPANWLGRHVAELFESGRPEIISILRTAARQGHWQGELVFSGIPVRLQFRAVRDDEGRLEALVGARLPEDVGETRDIFRTIPVGLILLDRSLRILEINEELAAVAGAGALPDTLVGIDVRSLAIFQTRVIQTGLESLPEDGEFELVETPLNGGSDAAHVQIRGKSLADADGQTTGYVLMLLSRTGKSNVERQLLRAQKMESIGNFASGLAHDFGNFVSVILGKAGVLRVKLPNDPHITGDLDGIEKAAKRAQHLSQDLMRFSRGSRGRVTSLDLNQLIGEVASLVRTSIGKRIDLVMRLAPELPRIEGDEVELQQLILNLCLNARDAMSDGGRLILETRRLSDDELSRFETDSPPSLGGVSLTVKDTGRGMAPDVAERIFEPFFTTKSDSNKGTGLGLAMVYSIVRRHGGTVDVRSDLGVGTAFEVAFPAAAESPMVELARPILVVDDEPAFREMIRLILEEDGHEVKLAANGVEALRTLRQDHSLLRLVILDLRMPGIDGLAVLEELRSLAPHLPVLVTTGYASHEEKTAALERGAKRVLDKPYRVAEFRAALVELIEEAEGAGAMSPSGPTDGSTVPLSPPTPESPSGLG